MPSTAGLLSATLSASWLWSLAGELCALAGCALGDGASFTMHTAFDVWVNTLARHTHSTVAADEYGPGSSGEDHCICWLPF